MSSLSDQCALLREVQERIDNSGPILYLPSVQFLELQAIAGRYGEYTSYIANNGDYMSKIGLSTARLIFEDAKLRVTDRLAKLVAS